MKQIVNEIKKIVEEKKYNLNDFESIFDAIGNIEEIKAEQDKEKAQLIKDKEELEKKITEIEKEKNALNNEYETAKKDLVDLKIKYIERFENPEPKEDDNKSKNNENITIQDLFKEE